MKLAAGARCALLLLVCPAWSMAGSASEAAKTDPARLLRGQQLMARYHCGTCHTIPGVPAASGKLAASLEQYGKRSYIAGRVANQPALLARWIMDPQAVIPGTAMPDMGVSAADARDMAYYLGQLE